MKKIVYSIFALTMILSSGSVIAQQQQETSVITTGKHEVSVQGGLGLSSLSYSVNNGESKMKMGGNVGLRYDYFINDGLSIGSGFELAFYNSSATLNPMKYMYNAVDDTGEKFDLNMSLSGYKEDQKSIFLNIPVIVQYQGKAFDDHKYFVSGGVKIGLPMSAKYSSVGTINNTSAYYESIGVVEGDNLAQWGLGNFSAKDGDKDIDFKTSIMLTLEAGMKWKLSSAVSLYTGVYFDYGLNNIVKDKGTNKLFDYNVYNPANYTENSLLASKYSSNGTNFTEYSEKVVPIAFGFKLRFAFDASKWF